MKLGREFKRLEYFVPHPYSSRSLSLSLSTIKECFDAAWSARKSVKIFVLNYRKFNARLKFGFGHLF
jgi:hypothetical protein